MRVATGGGEALVAKGLLDEVGWGAAVEGASMPLFALTDRIFFSIEQPGQKLRVNPEAVGCAKADNCRVFRRNDV